MDKSWLKLLGSVHLMGTHVPDSWGYDSGFAVVLLTELPNLRVRK